MTFATFKGSHFTILIFFPFLKNSEKIIKKRMGVGGPNKELWGVLKFRIFPKTVTEGPLTYSAPQSRKLKSEQSYQDKKLHKTSF